jgi:hypothetical protein
MLATKFFPTLLIVLDLFAAAGYAWHDVSDWRKIVYWISAAVLTTCVTY